MNTSATDQQLSAPRLSAPRLLTNEATIATHTHVATDRNRPRTLNTVNDRQKPTGIHTEQGHVAFWELSPGGRQLEADVKGTYEYSVHIRLAWSANGLLQSLSGSCSCPVSFDCKHVAAAMFAADAAGAFVGVTESDTVRHSKSAGWERSIVTKLLNNLVKRSLNCALLLLLLN